VEQEITLRDYGRVLWQGRWVLLIAAVACALIGLLTTIVKQTNYTASSIIYLGLATTANSGVPVSTPLTTPQTAQRILKSDEFVKRAADAAGVDEARVRNGVSFTVERIPGAVGGNQPTVATIHYRDRDPAVAKAVANAYAQGVYDYVEGFYSDVLDSYQNLYDDGQARIKAIQANLDRLRASGGGPPAVIQSLTQELATVQLNVDDSSLGLAKTKQIERPYIVSKATSSVSSAARSQRVRAVVFGLILGLILGTIITFVWRGSPARRGAD
jgi:uncharacterized protein involved in exopolysaccharide biosynthesis